MLLGFVHLGMAHIGASVSEWVGPRGVHLPDGIDHILFLVALVLGGQGLRELMKTATGFTVGHSITLALSFFGIVHLPSRWVEAAIALSIAYLAAGNLIARRSRHRWPIAAAFGLVHGFGFAAALEGLHLARSESLQALFGFNLGVEIGQLLIIATLAPIVFSMSREPAMRRFGLRPCTYAVMGTGAYWFALRLLSP